ncbi:hypothetical protein, partial [Salmonella sp. s51228]|uniref:hypothetical protein n=1 Tax=Salmonella sp. s51228 TaxID=3159652 RepID=UPI0039815900
MYTKVKPLLNVARSEDEMKAKEDELLKALEQVKQFDKVRKELEEKNADLLKEKNDLFMQIQSEADGTSEVEEQLSKMIALKADAESQLEELQSRLDEEEDSGAAVSAAKRKLEQEGSEMKKDIDDLELTLSKVEEE